ncbi:lipopolysaccharide biosynthesis protein [Streptomyces genisteinicus]|uniref:Lipopolysaccharide biosynthesis protein n=1 Tax=Streptomyces genisteinicus TaxID=2768068 RepID=A0A7H0HQW2_9ACTN|nr:lipopolysaccharide biosynthesis protein [Streptomyces genisteinicus]QNP62928.1 lipopolysaccharide biosynthesis protein [Streptomyces genisteinicus]
MTLVRALPRPPSPAGLAAMRRDPLLRNSFYLTVTTAIGAVAGFAFWILVARLYPAEDVGRASSLLSCVYLLSYLSLFGLSTTLVRHLPTSARRSEDTSTAVSTVSMGALLISGGFVATAPFLAPQLGYMHQSPLHIAAFVLLAASAAVNLLTDSVFVAFRATRLNLLINGVLMNGVKLALPVALVAAGPFGIFVASGAASAVAAVTSVAVLRRRLRLRVRPHFSWGVLRNTLAYSLTNYLSSSLNLVPQIVLPLVVLQQLGPVPAATYFIAFQIANLVYCASYAIGEALFAEGSQARADLPALARRSGLAMLAVTVPAAAFVLVCVGPVLGLFGKGYAEGGTVTLQVFAAVAPAVAFYTWTSFLLKVTRQLVASIVSETVSVAVILGVTFLMLDSGLHWAAIAWGAGNLASGCVAATALVRRRRRTRSLRPLGGAPDPEARP